MYKLSIIIAWIVSRPLKWTGYRFPRSWRVKDHWHYRIIEKVFTPFVANLLADGANLNCWLKQ